MRPTGLRTIHRLPVVVAAGLGLILAAAGCDGRIPQPKPAETADVVSPVPTPVAQPPAPVATAVTPTVPTQTSPPDTQMPTTANTSTASGSYSLTVGNSFVRRPGDYLWIEGALPEIVLESREGTRATKIGSFGTDVVFDHLEPGPYTVFSAARPCDGNCNRLDARVGECETVVQVPETSRLTVEHSVGRPCAVATS